MRRALWLTVLFGTLAWPGVVHAATISAGSTPFGPPPNGASGAPLLVIGGAEASNIEILGAPGGFIIRELGAAPLNNGAPTCSGGPTSYSCTLAPPGYVSLPTPLIQLFLGAGDDRFLGTGGQPVAVTADGGAGVDSADFSTRATPVSINGGGSEPLVAFERYVGGSANDSFRSLAGVGEAFVGGPGVDRVSYDDRGADQPVSADPDGAADDGVAGEADNIATDVENIVGGQGNDDLGGAAGVANVLDGGPGADTATYAGRADAITANLDDAANDGAAGEGDQLIGFEAIRGGEGNDFLSGSPGANTLAGGGGNDVLDGGDGPDSLLGESGSDQLTGGSGVDAYDGGEENDNVTAFDGLAETVECGGGTDSAAVDVADTLANCETVRRLDEALDVDRDGSLTPQDCNDANPAIKPGARDIPRNGIDEDCSGKDASFKRVRSTVRNAWRFNNVFAQATKFEVKDVPAGAVVRLKCTPPKGKKQACPFKQRKRESVRKKKTLNLLSSFKDRRLPVGTVIEVRISKKDQIARVVRFKTRAGKVPRAKTLCLPPGKKKPRKC